MAPDPNDDNISPFTDALDPDVPRDPFLLRWAKFLSLIIVPAILLGGVLVFQEYVMESQGETWARREEARKFIKHDSWQSFKGRFVFGACLGGGLGVFYVVRCLIRKVDP